MLGSPKSRHGLKGAVVAILDRSRGFGRARGGAVAMMFGLSVIPIALAVGAAIDYSRASDTQIFLSAAADAAALSAVTPSAMTLTAQQAQDLATSLFNGRAGQVKFASDFTGTITVQDDANGRSALVTFTANVPTTLMRLVGWSTMPVGGEARAYSAPPTYIDFYMLLDNTPSMGVAATQADITKMQSLTSHQSDGACAFACHIQGSTTDNYAIAKANNVQMRIDVVRTATQQLMDTATSTATRSGQYRVAINTFGASCTLLGVNVVSPLTSNLSAAKSSANAIDLMTIPYQNYNNDQCSDFNSTLAAANLAISAPGSGSTSLTPQKVLFFVSDGVNDSFDPGSCTKQTTGGRCQEPLNTATCTTIKNRGIKIAVLYTTYLPLPTNDWYNTWISPFASSINPSMQACASPGLFFEVSPSQGISDAMNALFLKTVTTARLSL